MPVSIGKILAKSFCPVLLCIFILACPLVVLAVSADEIIKKVEDNLNGRTAIMEWTMVVKNKRTRRTMKMKSYSVGKQKSFIKILYPGKDRGITFLKVDNAMWQYVPRIEKTIKIPASMMLQSWMGSDFTNDDLVRESSISEDYHAALLKETEQEYMLELIPREDAAVVWGRIVMAVSKKYFLPVIVRYYDEDNTLVRELTYLDVRLFGNRYYPARWLMHPMEPGKEGNETSIEISNAVFDTDVSESYFTKRALERYSR
jgi:outer membrane lipoprotein-sorting protein